MKKDVFNKQGDFITSVEISQMFGEVSFSECNTAAPSFQWQSYLHHVYGPLQIDGHVIGRVAL